MNILLLYPEKENNQKSISSRLNSFLFNSKKENLSLLEISIHLPLTWDILWADYIIICADKFQTRSTLHIAERCRSVNAKLVLCGNAIHPSDVQSKLIDHFVPDPAGFEQFSNDIANNTLQKIYTPVLSSNKTVPFRAYSLWGLIGSFSKQIRLTQPEPTS